MNVTNWQRALFFIVLDTISTYFAVYLAFLLRFDFNIPPQYIKDLHHMAIVLIALKVAIFCLASVYKISWRYFSFRDSILIVYLSILVTVIFVIIVYIFRDSYFSGFPRSVIPIEFFISISIILISRVIKRFFLEIFNKSALGRPTLVVATPSKASEIIKQMQLQQKYWPVAIFDNKNRALKIGGVSYKSFNEIKKYHSGIKLAIISDEFKIDEIYDKLKELGVREFKKYNSDGGIESGLQNVTVKDLLARKPKDLDQKKIANFIKDKVVLITGAGGSIGSELVRQCIKYGAKKLILLEHSEFNLYKIEQEVSSKADIVPVMQSIVNKELLCQTFKKCKPQIVIHAAAYKHVPLVEANVQEAIINNIIGTKNTIDCAIESGVQKFILISTDKAVRPTNVMGATKRVCELYAQNVEAKETEIVAVRFGNVLGSSGSVIPKFKEQIDSGGPVTVTHPEITRYFMLIPEACQLVLQAGAIGKGGEIFILDMGDPVKIVDLAKKMIELSGKDNIEIKFIGLRPGEKLYEELIIDDSEKKTEYESIFVAAATKYDINKLEQDINELLTSSDKISKLKEIVPEFNHKSN